MKQKRASKLPERCESGDAYTFVAVDLVTKLVPCFHMGRRTWADTEIFVRDLRSRIIGSPQITSEAFHAYYPAIRAAFAGSADYATLTKAFVSE